MPSEWVSSSGPKSHFLSLLCSFVTCAIYPSWDFLFCLQDIEQAKSLLYFIAIHDHVVAVNHTLSRWLCGGGALCCFISICGCNQFIYV